MKTSIVAVIAIAGLSVGGCASIVKGTSQSIAVNTAPVQGANCTLQNQAGTWTVVSPGAVTVPRTKHDINVKCEKSGFQAGMGILKSGTQLMSAGNIILGGVIGLGVDAATGAMNDYPSDIMVTLTPEAPAPMPAPAPAAKPTNTKPTS